MTRDEWWKNFALGIELDVAGTYIYNGAKSLDELQNLGQPVDVFEILYAFSIGLERLMKVAIVLLEHDSTTDMEALESSLISHNTMELFNRVGSHAGIEISSVQKEFLSLLSKFYKTHRYGRFSVSSVPNIKAEREMFLEFLAKHLSIEIPDNEFFPVYNSDRIRKFVGKVVKGVSDKLFSVIGKAAHSLSIYTDELRGDSKAIRVFYGHRLDFIEERIKRKELLLFLMHPDTGGDHVDLIRSFERLDLDPECAPSYAKALLYDHALPLVEGEIDELYEEVTDVTERIAFVDILDNEHLSYGGE